MKISRIIFSLAMILSPLACWAQEPIAIEGVVVRAQRTALAALNFDTLSLAQFRTASVGELLQSISPVNILDHGRGASSTASFRGTDPAHTNVYWNSLTINSPVEGSVNLSLLPLYSLDALSITAGISSLDVASGALGGAISITSRADWRQPFQVSATIGYGSFSSCSAMGSVRAGNDKFQSSTKISYSRSRNDFWFINRDIIEPSDPGKKTWQKNTDAQYANGALSQDFFIRLPQQQILTVSVLALSSINHLPELTTYEGPLHNNLTLAKAQSLRAAINYRRPGDRLAIEATLGATSERNYFTKDVLSSDQYIKNIDAHSQGHTVQGVASLTFRLSDSHSIVSATTLSGQWATSHEAVRQTGFEKGRFELSEKIELASHWSPRLTTTAMARFDLVGSTARLSGLVGAQYAWENGLALSARAGYNSHTPSLASLYYTPGANPNLKPEHGPTVELALAYYNKWLKVDLTLFDSWIADWIIWLPTSSQYWTPSNLRKVNAMGAELTANALWRFDAKRWGLSLRVSAALNRTINTGQPIKPNDLSQGVQLPLVPLVTGGAMGRIDYRERVWFTYWLSGQSIKSNSTANEMSYLSSIEPYLLHNIALGYRPWPWLSAEVTCRNLLNIYYYGIQNRPMAPLYVGATISVAF